MTKLLLSVIFLFYFVSLTIKIQRRILSLITNP